MASLASWFVAYSSILPLIGALCTHTAHAADAVAVGLACVTNTNGEKPEKHFAVNFDLTKTRWSVSEPGNTSEVFKTKSGPYVIVANTTSLKTATGQVAGILQDFNPSTAAEHDHRNDGKALETGRTFDWTVSIVTR